MQKQPYPFCPHGSYVGGCGVDHMCIDCEMGYEEPTIREQESTIRHMYSRFARRAAEAMAYQPEADEGPLRPHIRFLVSSFVWKDAQRELRAAIRYRDLIKSWSAHPDDDRWLYTKHQAAIDEWDRMQGDEQFESLPGFVLDGG